MLSKELDQQIQKVDATQFKKMLVAATQSLQEAEEEINDLNVFPVPDGDTGSNMYATISNAVEEAKQVQKDSVGVVADKLATGALMGARGNSGVILSQLLKGLSDGIGSSRVLTAKNLARGLQRAAEVSYQAVMKPVEGTILTVAKDAGNQAEELVDGEADIDIVEVLLEVVDEAEKSVVRTKEMLDTLEEAGVVDAGGKGYEIFLEGLLKGLVNGAALDEKLEQIHHYEEEVKQEQEVVEEYGYCTEFFLKKPSIKAAEFKTKIGKMGDSIMVVDGNELIKVHIHTEHPGKVLEKGLEYGQLSDIKIDNMSEQHNERIEKETEGEPDNEAEPTDNPEEAEEKQQLSVLAVAAGEGLSDIFKNLGVEYVLEGGQSMNPSIQDLMEGLEKVASDQVIILPNNKNVISTAEQVIEITDKEIEVIPTQTSPQGIAAMMAFNPEAELTEISDKMKEELEFVKTGEVTYAVRDTQINGLEIEEEDILGLAEGEIEVVSNDYNQATLELIDKMIGEDDALITVYVGKEVIEEKELELEAKLQEKYPDFDVELYAGEQPIYYYIVSVE